MELSKDDILNVSLKLFNAKRLSNVSLSDIAKESAVSLPKLKSHFNKREDIVEALYLQFMQQSQAGHLPDQMKRGNLPF